MSKTSQCIKQEYEWKTFRVTQIMALMLSLAYGISVMSEEVLLGILILGEMSLIADTAIVFMREDELSIRLGTVVLVAGFAIWHIPYLFVNPQNKVCAVIYALVIGGLAGYIIQQFQF